LESLIFTWPFWIGILQFLIWFLIGFLWHSIPVSVDVCLWKDRMKERKKKIKKDRNIIYRCRQTTKSYLKRTFNLMVNFLKTTLPYFWYVLHLVLNEKRQFFALLFFMNINNERLKNLLRCTLTSSEEKGIF
jgi:hypothetical protein